MAGDVIRAGQSRREVSQVDGRQGRGERCSGRKWIATQRGAATQATRTLLAARQGVHDGAIDDAHAPRHRSGCHLTRSDFHCVRVAVSPSQERRVPTLTVHCCRNSVLQTAASIPILSSRPASTALYIITASEFSVLLVNVAVADSVPHCACTDPQFENTCTFVIVLLCSVRGNRSITDAKFSLLVMHLEDF